MMEWVLAEEGMGELRVMFLPGSWLSSRLLEKSRASCPGGRFPPSFIHQVIIITGLDKLYVSLFSPWDALDGDRA